MKTMYLMQTRLDNTEPRRNLTDNIYGASVHLRTHMHRIRRHYPRCVIRRFDSVPPVGNLLFLAYDKCERIIGEIVVEAWRYNVRVPLSEDEKDEITEGDGSIWR